MKRKRTCDTPLLIALCLAVLALILAGCDESAGVVMVTPQPAGNTFQTYLHPSGVFWVRLPPDWAVNDLSTGNTLFVEFSPPDAIRPSLVVYVRDTDAPLTVEAFERAIADYQATYYGDAAIYQPQERIVQADGSWLIPALRPTGTETLQLNTFFDRAGPFFIVMEVVVPPTDSARFETMDMVIDSFGIDPNAVIESTGQVAQPPAPADQVATGVVGFRGMFEWTDSQGAFHINGQVVNNDMAALEFVRITAYLFDEGGNVLAEQSDFATADLIAPGGTAYFSVLFALGKPVAAVRYELHAAARHAGVATETYYGPANFTLEDEADFREGFLVVDGTVTNDGDATAYYVKITVAVFDGAGRVVATDTTFAQKRDLAPGETAAYQVTFFALGGDAISHTSTVQASLEP